ncbi:DUF1294 domain-containing protein [Fusibacter paucivorans]|uniref:DUF1294 domain-containing protein n=1 Tax=Fusibacter paucivorans TaxID=76009 RepID=A0ABS5PQE2_9FIRM|nr:DUF1294 domain-containing protein [Fusibacter paucivorans]MBS7527360.1 DUF1294 domain-containing protein [Fusibacter paucivorans]
MHSWLFCYFGLANVIALLLMCLDKRKAVKGKWRVSELSLLAFGWLGGAFGILSGMVVCKHKLSKLRFRFMMPIAGLVHWLIIGYYFLILNS